MPLPSWLTRPPLDTEKTFDRFVWEFGGRRVSDLIGANPSFDNADYLFERVGVVAELKTLKTDFGKTQRFHDGILELSQKYLSSGRMTFGSIFRPSERPREFAFDVVRLFRPPLERILKKANSQLKETRARFGGGKATRGILLLVNDEFHSLEPEFIMGILAQKLAHSYSSIDAYVYITLNHYVKVPGSDYAHLLWAPVYSGRGTDVLQPFVNELGAQWFKFLGKEIGPFDVSLKTDDGSFLHGTRAIPPPKRSA